MDTDVTIDDGPTLRDVAPREIPIEPPVPDIQQPQEIEPPDIEIEAPVIADQQQEGEDDVQIDNEARRYPKRNDRRKPSGFKDFIM
jgi:hypothetical protein